MDQPATPTAVALIPARSGSKRVPHKNIRLLHGHPLIAYTICAARLSGVFEQIVVATDSAAYGEIAAHYGASVPFLRSAEISGDKSPDIDWVRFMLDRLEEGGHRLACFSILRPTSPFRRSETIQRAWQRFTSATGIDSLRAVEPVEQHPGKMWVVRGDRLLPLLPLSPETVPWHSQQYAALPTVYVQNASLEMAWSRVVRETNTIAGWALLPFFTQGLEGFDINSPQNLWYAEHLIERGKASLPLIDREPYPKHRLPMDAC
jgi:CMP-N,N'-diacetyllegionaminic acid synthase